MRWQDVIRGCYRRKEESEFELSGKRKPKKRKKVVPTTTDDAKAASEEDEDEGEEDAEEEEDEMERSIAFEAASEGALKGPVYDPDGFEDDLYGAAGEDGMGLGGPGILVGGDGVQGDDRGNSEGPAKTKGASRSKTTRGDTDKTEKAKKKKLTDILDAANDLPSGKNKGDVSASGSRVKSKSTGSSPADQSSSSSKPSSKPTKKPPISLKAATRVPDAVTKRKKMDYIEID